MSGNGGSPILAHASDASAPPTPLYGSYPLSEQEIRELLDPRTFNIYHKSRECRERDRYAHTSTVIDMIDDRLRIVEVYGPDAELVRLQLENYMISDEMIWCSTVPQKVRWRQLKAYVERASYSDKFLDKLVEQFHAPDWKNKLDMEELARDALMMYLKREDIWKQVTDRKKFFIITEMLNCYVKKTDRLYQSTTEGYVYAEKLVNAHRDDLVCDIMEPAIASARRQRYGAMIFERLSDDDDYDYDDNNTPTSRSPSRSPSRSRSRSRS